MTITAPYNFVPLAKQVAIANEISPDLSGVPSQDFPHPGGSESGTLAVTLVAHTPFLVSKGEGPNREKRFFLDPHDNPALPGSSWRGAIRNVLEIATFGQMRLVADQRTGMRDLNAVTDYRDHFTETTATGSYASKAKAGWLKFEGGKVILRPCDYGRVDHYTTLNSLSKRDGKTFRDRIDAALAAHRVAPTRRIWERPGQVQLSTDTTIAEVVERIFLKGLPDGKQEPLGWKLWVETQSHDHHSGKLHYKNVTAVSAEGSTQIDGTLVFTGMPSKHKHMEFFFFPDGSAPIELDPEVFRKFLDVHEAQEKPSPTWDWRKGDFYDRKAAIPVFFLTEGTGAKEKVKQIGLSMMFKMAGDSTVHNLIDNTSTAHLEDESDVRIDLATRIFGRIGGKGKTNSRAEAAAFRSRVSFGWGKVEPGTWKEGKPVEVHLQRPKVGYFPTYIRQRDFASLAGDQLIMLRDNGHNDRGEKKDDTFVPYRSYMNWKTKPPTQEEVRGWKRYPVLNRLNDVAAPKGSEFSTLVPLESMGNQRPTFHATLRYHNLHPIELGALLWAVTWGRNPRLRHAMGMGRPLGWGQIEVRAEFSPVQEKALAAFVEAMEVWAAKTKLPGGWKESVQLRQLQAMADPIVGDANKSVLRQMVLAPDRNVNDFIKGKKLGSVLPEYGMRDISVDWSGPDPVAVKPPNGEDDDYGVQRAKKKIETMREAFDSARKARAEAQAAALREAEEARKIDAGREAGKAAAANTADKFPPGSMVRVFDPKRPEKLSDKKRLVVGIQGGSRLVSRSEVDDGRYDPIKVERLRNLDGSE